MKKKIMGILLFCLLFSIYGTTVFAAEKEMQPYYVTVNLTDNIVTVYEKDEKGEYTVPKKAFFCSAGKSTPEGTFQTMVKYDWRYLFGDVWGQYATRITGHYLFHSVPYFEKDKSTLEYEEYNKLGTTASMGCIRLTVKDAKWLYDNCPVGTTVKMYRGNVEEPLQPAAVQKLNVNDEVRRGWDPTDPDKWNPWRQGELREMQVAPSWLPRTMETYYENGTYYLSAADAEELFSCIDVKLDLPEALTKEEEICLSDDNGAHILQCRIKEDTIYYKIRDIASMAGVEMTWNGDLKEIGIVNGENVVTLCRVPLIRDVVTLPAKIAAFFLG